jgi:hypothetical protein
MCGHNVTGGDIAAVIFLWCPMYRMLVKDPRHRMEVGEAGGTGCAK